MDGSGDLKNAGPAQVYDGPPDYRAVGRHGVFPQTSHDEIARLNFLAHLNRHLSTRVMPHVKTAWEQRAEPKLMAETGAGPRTRHDVRKALLKDPTYQTWSALRRLTMEQRQQAGRWTTIRQAEQLAAINRTNVNVQALAVEGALTGDRDMIVRAVQMDPLTGALLPLSRIREMVGELFTAEARFLPQFS